MRKRIERDDAAVYDPVQEALEGARARLGDPYEVMSPAAEAKHERRRVKWQGRIDKALAQWRAMSPLDQKAWAGEYIAEERRRYNAVAKAPKAHDLPLLFAIVTICRRDAEKAAKRDVKHPEPDDDAAQREAVARTRAARAERRAPATDAPPVGAEPSKPRKHRTGPRYGTAAIRRPGGRLVAPIYDEDD